MTATPIPRRLAALIVMTVAALVLLNIVSSEALARRHRGRSSAAAAAARKKQVIQTIQNQVAIARQVLAAAESQAAMSEQEVNALGERLATARSDIEAADSEEHQACAELRELESNIIRAQGPESPLGKAQAAIDEAHQALDRELHRIVSLPERAIERAVDGHSLSTDGKDTLRNDSQYQLALERLESARRDFAQIRQDLFKRNPEWVATSQAAAAARKKEAEVKQHGSVGATRLMPAKRTLRTAQEVAAAARATIARGEAMLGQLGVKNVGNAGHKPSVGKTPKRKK